jgi:hypothetical protein
MRRRSGHAAPGCRRGRGRLRHPGRVSDRAREGQLPNHAPPQASYQERARTPGWTCTQQLRTSIASKSPLPENARQDSRISQARIREQAWLRLAVDRSRYSCARVAIEFGAQTHCIGAQPTS